MCSNRKIGRKISISDRMRSMHILLRSAAVTAAFGCVLTFPASAQVPGTPFAGLPMNPNMPSQRARHTDLLVGSGDVLRESRRQEQLNVLRQKSMISDAAKLLRLAQELNAAMLNEGAPLSPQERLHRVAEIEKLAKNVKEKMRYAASAPEPFVDPLH